MKTETGPRLGQKLSVVTLRPRMDAEVSSLEARRDWMIAPYSVYRLPPFSLSRCPYYATATGVLEEAAASLFTVSRSQPHDEIKSRTSEPRCETGAAASHPLPEGRYHRREFMSLSQRSMRIPTRDVTAQPFCSSRTLCSTLCRPFRCSVRAPPV
jgi:hypothetical protein